MKIEKGMYGYVKSQRRVRLLRTILGFAVDFAIFGFGLYMNQGSRRNIYTIMAAVGVIPAAMSLVSTVMIFTKQPMAAALHEEIAARAGQLPVLYEMYLTTKDRRLMLDAVVMQRGAVVCYCQESDSLSDLHFMEEHIRGSLRKEGVAATVKIFGAKQKKQFLDRLSQLAEKYGGEAGAEENTAAAVLKAISV